MTHECNEECRPTTCPVEGSFADNWFDQLQDEARASMDESDPS